MAIEPFGFDPRMWRPLGAEITAVRRLTMDDLLVLIDLIYQAGLDPSRWQEVLTRLVAPYDGSAVLYLQEADTDRASFLECVGQDDQATRDYQDYYAALNPAKELWRAAHEGTILDFDTIADPEELRRGEFYNDFFKPRGMHHVMGAAVIKRAEVVTNLSIQRSARAGPWSEQERARLSVIVTHTRRSLELSRRLTFLALERDMALSKGGGTCGYAVVDQDRRVLFADKFAEATLRDAGALGVFEGRLTAASRADTERLTAAIRASVATAAGNGACAGNTFVLPARRVGLPLVLKIYPWRGDTIGFGVPGPAALICVEDSRREPRRAATAAAAMHGLTPAETRLLEALLNGQRITEYAEAASIRVTTARTQLAALFAKTGQRRQADLVRVMLTPGNAPIPNA